MRHHILTPVHTLLVIFAFFTTTAVHAESFTKSEIENSFGASEVDVLPEPIKQVAPEVPAGKTNTQGLVRVGFLVDTAGNVVAPRVLKTSEETFNAHAITAIAQWKFKPAEIEGQAVTVRLAVPFRFR